MPKPERPFLNRELSWLEFNQRVLDEALDPATPLLERVKFLAITASNMDEFFMVRVGGLQLLAAQGSRNRDPAGMTPRQQLEAISERVHRMVEDQYACYASQLEPALAQALITRVRPDELTEEQSAYAEQVFNSEVFPIVSPMAVGLAANFPLLHNLGLNVLARLAPAKGASAPRFAILPCGIAPGRFFRLPAAGGYAYMLVEDLVRLFIERFFPGERVLECVPFRLTRNADMSVREDMASDLMTGMQEVLDARKTSDCVRLEVDEGASKISLVFIQRALRVRPDDIYTVQGPLRLRDFMTIATLDGFDDLKYEDWPPQPSPDIDPKVGILDQIARKDVLLSHPYDSFEPVIRLVEEAADDPNVMAIKMILYRTSRNSPIIAALGRAAEQGKYVTALVELKARFDEARNIGWAQQLEQSGVQVIYGVKGLKTHAKLCIVVRREPQGVMRYMHFGTGNYNEITARLYSDISYLTCNEDLAADASAFFNAITGYSQPQQYLKLKAAPINLRDHLIELIQAEAERKRQGQKALIMAKVNSLADTKMIDALYDAAQAGVKIMLNVRGICCLCPGVKGLSESITVVSIIDRFLEHSRVFYFRHGGDEQVFISSADWMSRNLVRRVELMTPVENADCRRKLVRTLKTYFDDNAQSSMLLPDGRYRRLSPPAKSKRLNSQEALYQWACREVEEARKAKKTVFEPHRPKDTVG